MKVLAKVLRSETFAVFFLLVMLVVLNIVGLTHKRLTYDEGKHYKYGMQILAGSSDRFDDSKMPFSALNAAPAKIYEGIKGGPFERILKFLGKMRTGRYITIFFSLLVAIVVHRWARQLYGRAGGLLSLLLYAFCPNMLAHSRLITTDVYCAGMIVISLYFFWRFLNRGGWEAALLSSVTLGLSQLAKYTCVFLYPLFLLIALAVCARRVAGLPAQNKRQAIVSGAAKFLWVSVFFGAVSLVVINLGFGGNRTLTKFGDYQFKSRVFNLIQSEHPALKSLRVPLPYPYLEGLDWVKYNEETGKSFGAVYLFGEFKKGEGFPGYYFYVFLYKVPLGVTILLLLALLNYGRSGHHTRFFENELFLAVPVLFFAIYFNFFYAAQIGMRYFLMVLPLLYIFCGNLFERWAVFKAGTRVLYSLLLAYVLVSVLSYTPHYLSYFNELVGDRKNAYKVLADSNIDWGENEWFLQRYQKEHPETLVNPELPVAGHIVVGVNELVGVNGGPKKFEWLRENYEPVGHIAYTYLVYNVSSDDLPHTPSAVSEKT
jgi:4-amino-4-deoxy-L-arabinose transferase-like glycosyltransferase